MFYIGRVVDNRNFGKDGYISVLLPQKSVANGGEKTLSKGLWRVASSYKSLIQKGIPVECMVASPMGSGYNTGFFQMPQINSIGLVVECEGVGSDPKWDGLNRWGRTKYIWLGGLYGCKRYGEKVIIPNDDTVSNELDYEDKTLITEGAEDDPVDESEEDDRRDTITDNEDLYQNSQIILKTKSSYVNNQDEVSPDEVNFKKIPGENTIVINKNKVAIRHNTNKELNNKTAIADIIENDNEIRINRIYGNDGEQKNHQTIVLNSDNTTITSVDDENGNYSELILNNDGTIDIDSNNKISVDSETEVDLTVDNGSNTKMSDNLIQNTTENGGMIKINSDQITISNKENSLKRILKELINVLDTGCKIDIPKNGNVGSVIPKQFESVKKHIEELFEE